VPQALCQSLKEWRHEARARQGDDHAAAPVRAPHGWTLPLRWTLAWAVASFASACVPDSPGSGAFWTEPDGGTFSRDGAATGGDQGGTGGASGTGGSSPAATGGSTGSGGQDASGGATATGGTGGATAGGSGGQATGGSTASGGMTATGGVAATGGTSASGGTMAMGGSTAGGGRVGAGGTSASGGRTATGGSMASGGSMGSGGSSGSQTGSLTITVTTKAAGGRYQPDNVGAIWIADSNTKFVKSLFVWGSQRRREIKTWVSATTAAGMASSVVDAVTAATYKSHGTRMATWNGTDTAKAIVPDGAYKVCFELEDGSSAYQCIDFNKSRNAQTLMPADNASFTKRTIGYTP